MTERSAREWTLAIALLPLGLAFGAWARRVPPQRIVTHWAFRAEMRVLRPCTALATGLPAARLYRVASAATRFAPGGRRCLPRSLLLFWLLSRRQEDPELCVGVAKQGAELRSHAWVELGGRSVGETERMLAPFQPMLRLRAS